MSLRSDMGMVAITCAKEARPSEESKKQSVGASEVPPWGFQDGGRKPV